MRHLLFLLLISSTPAIASEMPPCTEANCVDEQQFYLSLALGYGERSNPLYQGESLPLVVLPDVYYYGKYWFFDNGKLGTNWSLSEQWQLSLVGQLNPEKGYFQKWFSGNLMQFSYSNTNSPSISQVEKSGAAYASVREVSHRPTAFDAGLQLDWFGDNWQWQTQIWQDISHSYHGQHASTGLMRYWQNPAGYWQLGARLYWKSRKLIDTYYGIDNNEPFYIERYNGRASWQPEVRLNWQKPLTEQVTLLAFLRYLSLDDAMTDSPLVQSDHITTWFFGVSYRFF